MDITEVLLKQKHDLESKGYSVAYICVYGSQNYELDVYTDEYQSDIDTKAIIVPTLDDLIKNSKPISTVIDTEHGQCDIKDIRSYFQTLLKANPAYIETLFTKYYIVDNKFKNEFDQIFKLREDLIEKLSAQFIRAIYGMMCEKEKALCHPYPTIAHKIEKYGYDGKQAHHILRLFVMMNDYFINKKQLINCFVPEKHLQNMMDLKLNKPKLDYVKLFVDDIMEKAKKLKEDVLSSIDESKINYGVKDDFLKLSQTIIKNKIIQEINSK